jgi:hypothetical protein
MGYITQQNVSCKTKKPLHLHEGVKTNSGSVLLSHTVTHAVPSALESLTSVFEMGTGVSSLL